MRAIRATTIDTGSLTTAAGAAAAAAIAGVAIQAAPSPLAAIAGLAGVLVLLLAPIRVVVAAAVLATFVTRLSFDLVDLNVRFEHVITLVLALRLFLRGEIRLSTKQGQLVLLLSTFLTLNVIYTWWAAPLPSQSVTVIGWLALDLILFITLCSVPQYHGLIIRTGIVTAAIAAAAGCVLWLLAATTSSRLGVQFDNQTGGYASYVLSYEANTFASSLAIWGVVAVLVRWPSARWQFVLQILVVAGILAAQTRAALVGYVAALALITVLRRSSWGFRPSIAFIAVLLIGAWAMGFAPKQLEGTATKFTRTFDFGTGSGYLRANIWRSALADVRDDGHYVFGLGTNTFGQRHLEVTRPGQNIGAYLSNLPLAILYDTGILGLFTVGAVLLAVTSRLRAATWIGVGTVYLIASAATSIFWFSLTWILLALAAAKLDRPAEEGEPASSPAA